MYIELLILMQIEQSPKHGYEIKKEIERDLGYLTDVNHNMLYPTLRRFTEQGFVTKQVNEQAGRPNQVVYEITESGKKEIKALIRRLSEKDARHQIEFLIKVSLFERIPTEDQLRILKRRQMDLESLCENLMNRQDIHTQDDWYKKEVLELSIHQIKQELEWIQKLIDKVHML